MVRCAVASVALGFAIFAAGTALAAEPGQGSARPRGGASVEAGYGQLAEDNYFNFRLKLGYLFEVPEFGCDDEEPSGCKTDLRFSAQAPLRLRVQDAQPGEQGLLREADWDEPTDFLRVLRTIEYGHPTETLNGKIGELGPVSLGHSTIVSDYYNVVTTDHYQLGASATFNSVYGGAEMLLGDVVSPSLVGGRVFVHPWALVDKDSLWSRVAVGATLVSDLDAPSRLAAADERADATFNPVVREAQATALWGVDMEVSLVDSEHVGIVPYADFNKHTSLGSGMHAGSFITVRPTDGLELLSRVEYRRVSANYLPDYVGPLYEIERFQFKGWGQVLPAPKVRAAASIDGGAVHGVYGSLTAQYEHLVSVTAAFSDHQGPQNQMVRLKVATRPLDSVHLGLFCHKQNFDRFSQVFDLDGSLAVAEARVGVYGPIFLLGSYGRTWRLAEAGDYQAVDEWNAGVGASFGF